MLSKPTLDDGDLSLYTTPKTSTQYSRQFSVQWKFWFIENYTFGEGNVIPLSEIIDHAEHEKENLGMSSCTPALSYNSLGAIVNDTWGEQVKRTRKGPRSNRQNCFLHLVRKPNRARISDDVAREFATMAKNHMSPDLPRGWMQIVDSDTKICLTRFEKWEFEGQRICTELSIELLNMEEIRYVIKSHGSEVVVRDLKVHTLIEQLPLKEQVSTILQFLDTSVMCTGFLLGDNDLIAMMAHKVGVFNVMSDTSLQEKRVFSQNCQLIASLGTQCSNCKHLKKVDIRRKKRKQETASVHKNCNKRFLTKEEINAQLMEEKKLHRSTFARENYWRAKHESVLLEMADDDHMDLTKIFNDVNMNDVPSEMQGLWEQQSKILHTKSKNGYRWNPKIMRLCLELYCKNPHVLDPLRKFVILPSNKTIRLYKNKVQEMPGWNDDVLGWCLEEACKQNLKKQDYWGGFIIDEMKIQENLEMVHRNGKHKLVGFVNLGEAHDIMSELSGGSTTPQLASHVLQFIFLSDNGFRFPIAQFPSGGCTPSDLYFNFWDGVLKMQEYGFVIYWCIMDGADVNRQFIKIHFKGKDAAKEKFVAENIYTGNPMIFIMDPKHNIKKIRNNLEKSNVSGKPRCLKIGGKNITWIQFKAAYNWDQTSCSLPIHERLTAQHFQLDPSSKMRNHLAENVLDKKMLFLMQKYQESLEDSGRNGRAQDLEAAIQLLSHTSELITFFNDKLVISSTSDNRLKKLISCYNFFSNWREETQSTDQFFVSSKLWFDLQSMCLGFQALVSYKLRKFPSCVIKPAIVNQDCVENHFCQVRACNGQNNNPTFAQQQFTQNSIRFGQTTISIKSNTGKSSKSDLTSCSLPK